MLREENRLRLSRLLGLWDYLVDDKVGIINEIYQLPIDEDDPNFFHFLSTSCNTARFTSLKNFSNNGGVSTDRYVGMAKAIGEAVERYCSAIFNYDELLLAPYRTLDCKATPPDTFALYQPEQFESSDLLWKPLTDTTVVSWTQGVSLVTHEDILVPAAVVYVPYHYLQSRQETAFVQPISTGLAAGSSGNEAILSGLCEAIERDAFTLMWQARMSPPVIDPATLPESGQDLLRRYAAVDLEIKLLDITTNICVPTVMSIALSDASTSPAIAVAAATDPSAETALIKSLEELAHTRKYAKQLMDYTPELPVDVACRHPRVQNQEDHLRFYCPQDAKAFMEFAWTSSVSRDFSQIVDYAHLDVDTALETALREVSGAGLDVIHCDLTTPDIAALGLHVARVVVPGLHPLFMGYQNRALGGKRLYEVPQRLGYVGLEPGQPDNPYPHPFP